MGELFEKIFCWHGWTFVKWPFGVFLATWIVIQIWYMNINPHYEQDLKDSATKHLSTAINSLSTIPEMIGKPKIFDPVDKVKNIR